MGASTETGAAAFVVDLLSQIADLGIEARGRDLRDAPSISDGTPLTSPRTKAAFALTNGRAGLCIALPFGSVESMTLAQLAREAVAAGAKELRFAPGRMLIAICPDAPSATTLARVAAGLGFIILADDPRLMISACTGAPACRSAHFATRTLAGQLATLPDLLAEAGHIHVSGCAKGCAHPGAAPFTLVGSPDGAGVVANGTARDAPSVQWTFDEVTARLPSLVRAARQRAQEHP